MKPPRYGAVMKVIRRIHMYLGLLLYPWVLLYGGSGMLFNHPGIGRSMDRTPLPPDRFQQLTGFTPWEPQVMADAVLAELNAQGHGRYTLAADPELTGFPIFVGPRPDGGKNMLIMSLTAGRGGIAQRPPAPSRPPAPFAGPLDTPYTMPALSERFETLLPDLDIPGTPLQPHPKVAPELHLVLSDGQREWNAVYNLGSGRIDGRPSDSDSQVPFVELLEKLHTQHHFPVHMGPSAFWALFADLTGLCLMLWAVSGLLMWWQIRPARRWGAAAVVLSLALAVLVMSGMTRELLFLPALGMGGP